MKTGWGQRLRDVRGVTTQDEFSGRIGISRSMWADYEKELASPRVDTLLKLAELTGASVEWIVTGKLPTPHLVAEIEDEYLVDAIETALLSADAVKAKGRVLTANQIAAHAKVLYELRLKEAVDGIVSPDKNKPSQPPGGQSDVTANENGDHEVHRRSRAGKR